MLELVGARGTEALLASAPASLPHLASWGQGCLSHKSACSWARKYPSAVSFFLFQNLKSSEKINIFMNLQQTLLVVSLDLS